MPTLESLPSDLWGRFRTPRSKDGRDGLLSKLRMVGRDEAGVLRPTVAGILMASPDPRQWLPNAFIQAVAYKGGQMRPRGDAEAYQLDASDITGPLDWQVKEACRFVARNMKVAAFKEQGRVDRPQFDMAAVFESDRQCSGPPRLLDTWFGKYASAYSRTVWSFTRPERSRTRWSPRICSHIQSSRNEVLSSLLAKCPVPVDIPRLATNRETLMDRRGEGMRIIVDNSLELSGRMPEYKMIGGSEFLVKIHAPQEQDPKP